MKESISFVLDGKPAIAYEGESIWEAANREGLSIPHLCHSGKPGYRSDGNCRACMVEIGGERTLGASCIRKPTEGMQVFTNTDRPVKARQMVFELLAADQPAKEFSPDPDSNFWVWADGMALPEKRFSKRTAHAPDTSHGAMQVNLEACIQCNLCVRACREVQVNDVIGMANRGSEAKIVFDFDDPMGESSCVACGECVQSCPTGALMEASLLDSSGIRTKYPDREVASVCPYCGVGCQISYKIKNDKLLFVDGRDGPANKNRLCVKGRFGFDYVHHVDRLTTPLIRRTDVGKQGQVEIDPRNPFTHFREASWEEALEVAARGFNEIKSAQGSKGLAGFGSAKGSNEEAYLVQKLIRVGFGTNNVDHCTRLCHASSVSALMECIGSGAVTAPFTSCEHAEVMIVIGANPNENHPVAATFFKQQARAGKTLIVMDPRGHTLKKYATHMLQFKPGSDVALLNALLNVIVDEGLHDPEFVSARTEGFEVLRDHLEEFTPEKMGPICGIDPETLRVVARKYATSSASIIFWGMGISQHSHGTDNARCLIDLALITGQVGRPGTGLHPLRGQNNVQGASDAGLIPMVYPDYQAVSSLEKRAVFEDAWNVSLDPEPGLTVVEIMDAVHEGTIKGIYVMGENPAMSDPDAHHARDALAALDHLVVQDIFLTETAFYADVVLPASAWPEKNGTVTNTNRTIQMGRAALPMPGNAREDWWIIQELARRMGLNWNYEHPRDVFAEMAMLMPSFANITWDRLEREHAVTYPCDAPEVPGNEIVFSEKFPTLSGRGKLTTANVIPPDEMPDENYPFILTTGRVLEHWHTGSMTRRSKALDDIEPSAVATVNKNDLTKLGLSVGDSVRIETRRGNIELIARVDSAVPAGVIFLPFCFSEAPANFLTNPKLDPFGKIPEFKYCAARLLPAEVKESISFDGVELIGLTEL